MVDQAGMPVRIVLSQGQSSDKTVAPTVLEGLAPDRDLIADRGYDARALVDLVESRGGRAHIPTCRDRSRKKHVFATQAAVGSRDQAGDQRPDRERRRACLASPSSADADLKDALERAARRLSASHIPNHTRPK